jgi:hypothetical protein
MNLKPLTTLALAIAVTLSSFAGSNENTINDKVKSAFSEKFTEATEVSWNTTSSYLKASFRMNDQSMFAYYTPDGNLLGISRNLSSPTLPLKLNAELKRMTATGWITELFEYASEEENAFYATIENADQKIFVKSSANNNWTVIRKEKKN